MYTYTHTYICICICIDVIEREVCVWICVYIKRMCTYVIHIILSYIISSYVMSYYSTTIILEYVTLLD